MGANGHLIDQFLQDNSNKRIDHYGGSIENRTRLLVRVVEALADVWGANRVGVRIAPSGTFNGMADSNPRTLFRFVAERLNEFGLAYLHVIEPRIKGGELIAEAQEPVAAQELSKIFQGPLIAAGGFEANTAEATVSKGDADLIAFGRHFIANPDLPSGSSWDFLSTVTTEAPSMALRRTGTQITPHMKGVKQMRCESLNFDQTQLMSEKTKKDTAKPVAAVFGAPLATLADLSPQNCCTVK